ncbi:MAG: hypothetical protein K9W44_02570 [Candidatus Lokiarchaeota archaeon]|nr:hypothetical protein [Candidatus Harpocratesius repetitus]
MKSASKLKLREINAFISSSPDKIVAFQHMIERLSKESNLCRAAINDMGLTAIVKWEEQKGVALHDLLKIKPTQRNIELDKLLAQFKCCMEENLWSEQKIRKNLTIVRQTFEKILEIS